MINTTCITTLRQHNRQYFELFWIKLLSIEKCFHISEKLLLPFLSNLWLQIFRSPNSLHFQIQCYHVIKLICLIFQFPFVKHNCPCYMHPIVHNYFLITLQQFPLLTTYKNKRGTTFLLTEETKWDTHL